ncbi:MAG: hypothetical protein SH848_00630 [Saprospiraceae bacterium]|nr:hypothetical protein [Saprospiraceae bacterium]MDZ4702400.1 hypothetical protein [Saprospiraceae bacterium]
MTHLTILQFRALWRIKHYTFGTMSKWFFFTALFFFTTSAYAQMGVVIASQNGNEICAGFTPENCAHVAVISQPPLPVPDNSILVYTWTAQHANGSWTWHTNYPARIIPFPFVGQYKIQVKVEYMRKGTKRPYAAFFSNKLNMMGLDCQ